MVFRLFKTFWRFGPPATVAAVDWSSVSTNKEGTILGSEELIFISLVVTSPAGSIKKERHSKHPSNQQKDRLFNRLINLFPMSGSTPSLHSKQPAGHLPSECLVSQWQVPHNAHLMSVFYALSFLHCHGLKDVCFCFLSLPGGLLHLFG